MKTRHSSSYRHLVIRASSAHTEIWLGDSAGHFVQKEIGTMDTHLREGDYVVEFQLGGPCYPLRLRSDLQTTESEIAAGSPCQRPVPEV